LTTVIWNDDTNDWAITEGTQTVSAATKILQKAYAGPKSPGLCILEHELSSQAVNVFINTYPLIAQNGWTAKSIPDALGASYYLNAADNTSPVTALDVAQGAPQGAPSGGSSGNSTSSSTGTATAAAASATSSSSTSYASPALSWSSWLGFAAMVPVSVALL
jgi:chitin deacetylase